MPIAIDLYLKCPDCDGTKTEKIDAHRCLGCDSCLADDEFDLVEEEE